MPFWPKHNDDFKYLCALLSQDFDVKIFCKFFAFRTYDLSWYISNGQT